MNKKLSRVTLSAIILITLLCFFPLRNLRFEFDIKNFFPEKDPDLAFFQKFNERFRSELDDDYIFIGLTNNKGIFDQRFLQKADSLAKYIKWIDHIISVYSITDLSYYYSKDGKMGQSLFIHIQEPQLYRSDSVKLFQSSEVRNTQISKDGKSILISAFHENELTSAQKEEIISSIDRKINSLHFDNSYFTAKIRVEKTYISETEKNLKTYLLLSFLIIAFTLFLLFRSLRDILIPFAVILISLIWTLAIIGLLNYPLDIISSLLPPILAIVCMSDIIHITIRYKEELKEGHSKEIALERTFKDIGPAIFFTSLTTAVGFFSLCITNILPIKMFGFFAGIGVMLEFFITMGFMWSVNYLSPAPSTLRVRTVGWQKFLRHCFSHLIRFKYYVLAVSFLVVLISVYYSGKIEINRSLLKEIPKDNPILKEYKFFETQFSGTRLFEVQLSVIDANKSFYQLDLLREVNELERYVEDSLNVGLIFSPVPFVKSANKVFMGGDQSFYALPYSQKDVDYCFQSILMSPFGSELSRFVSQDGRYARISGKLPDLNTKDYKVLSEKLHEFFNLRKVPFQFSYKETGSSILFDKVSDSLIVNMVQGIVIGFVLIALIGFFMLRSLRVAVIVFIVNVIPLLLLAGVMGLLGIWLKEDTSIIFSIALGLAVDNTIHFVSRFKLEVDRGLSVAYAVKRTYLSIGKAMIVTTLILFAGFMTLIFSSFGGTFYIGVLVSFCLVFALIADLTLTPLLLLMFFRKKHSLL
ncbi:MAG: MMPL family transporter [bacterium]|nr:MMPL family transporter [bacterium]